MSDWQLVPIREVADLYDGPHQTAPSSDEGEIVYLNVGDIRKGRIDLRLSRRVSEDIAERWNRRVTPQANDVVFGYEATVGEAAPLSNSHRWCLGRRVGLLRPRPAKIEPRFLAYSWYSPAFQEILRANRIGGSTIESIRLTDVPEWRIALPPLPEQRVIAHILGALDDKIELNRRMGETLEAMARALFNSWFVDFDPVRAKAEGRDPGLPKDLADIFPDRLVDSKLGEIPEGWNVKPFADTVQIIGGGTPKTSEPAFWGGGIPWFSVVDAPAPSAMWVIDTEKKVTRKGIESSAARVLPIGATILSARGTVGRTALVGVPMAMNQSCYGLQGKFGSVGYFTHFATRAIVGMLQQSAHGSVFDTITRNTLTSVTTIVPPEPVVNAFESRIDPLLKQSLNGVRESHILSHLRDALLPKLIAGELRPRTTTQAGARIA